MFQFPSLASATYVFSDGSRGFAAGGCPIRKSPGQSLLGGSPELIAACHVLHRLLTPGHPPCALIHLTTTQRMNVFRTHSRIGFQRTRAAQRRAPLSKSQEFVFFPASLTLGRASFALPAKAGGGERDRTDGLLVANQALSQLRYTTSIKKPAVFPATGRPNPFCDAPGPP